MNNKPTDEPTKKVSCKICGKRVALDSAQLCNRCWGLYSRISSDPEIARKILNQSYYNFLKTEVKCSEDSTSGAMLLKTMEANEKLRSNIDRLLQTCGKPGTCRGSDCRKPIVWMKAKNGKNTCYNYDGSTHWANCKSQRMFKNGGTK